ncbi:hypothetical protein [Halococcus sp. PRR34]|uniref:hypothetical protein n=1 Tax=Halococcus sp. PRR34 TaxID=3020830 RepID=UPI0023604E8B|nr:hypothetical protein [Halococcus sp. PRR34]
MSTDEPPTAAPPDGPTPIPPPLITIHAIERFNRRVALRDTEWLGLDLYAAFRDAVPVGVPEADDRGMLHAPSGAVFIYKRQPRTGQTPVVVTTIHERMADLNDSHLNICEACSHRIDPQRERCPWCAREAR